MATIFISSQQRASAPVSISGDGAQRHLSYDDDIDWILESFAHRTFASGAMLLRQVQHEDPTVLKASGRLVQGQLVSTVQIRQLAASVAHEHTLWSKREPLLAWSECTSERGNARVLALPLPLEDGARLILCVAYDVGATIDWDACEAYAMRLHPVLVGYFRLWAKLRAERVRVVGLEAALDIQGVGIAILDRGAEILFLNSAMRRIIDAGDGLRRHGRALVATDPGCAAHLQVAIAQTIGAASEFDCGGRPAPLLALKRTRGAGAMLAVLTSIDRICTEPHGAKVVVSVLDPSDGGVRALKPVCALYGLSPVETALVIQLVGGTSLGDAAVLLRIKENTACAYLKQIFSKTETSRQVDLVRLMLNSVFRFDQIIVPA